MRGTDKRDRLEEDIFTYRASKEGKVLIYWYDKHVSTLAGAAAQKFLRQIQTVSGREAQLVMAKATGNFKRGNERRGAS